MWQKIAASDAARNKRHRAGLLGFLIATAVAILVTLIDHNDSSDDQLPSQTTKTTPGAWGDSPSSSIASRQVTAESAFNTTASPFSSSAAVETAGTPIPLDGRVYGVGAIEGGLTTRIEAIPSEVNK